MMCLRIVEDRLTGERWLQFPLPDSLNDEDDRALLAFARRFLNAWERQRNCDEEEIGELERLYRADGVMLLGRPRPAALPPWRSTSHRPPARRCKTFRPSERACDQIAPEVGFGLEQGIGRIIRY